MTQDEADAALRHMLRRATLRGAAYGDDHITANFDGHAGDSPNGVPMMTPWGVSGLPPAGASLLVASLGGRVDRSMVLAAEHMAHRPKGLPAGGAALHDAGYSQIRLGAAKGIHAYTKGDAKVVRKRGKKVYLGGDPDQGGVFAPVMTASGPSQVVFALVVDRDYDEPGA